MIDGIFTFEDVQRALLEWPRSFDADEMKAKADDGIIDRLQQVLSQAQRSGSLASVRDLAALLRHALLARSIGKPSAQRVAVPVVGDWPIAAVWRELGFDTVTGPTGLVLTARTWRPSWMTDGDQADWEPGGNTRQDIFADVFAGDEVRPRADVPIDPFLGETTGFDSYVCPGQREAVRSLLFMPAGTTLIVNLPTGSGKSLVAEAAVLSAGLESGLTLFVVPTKALATDQARRMRALLRARVPANEIPPLVWHGGLGPEVRQTIKSNIRRGRQGILFTSPESVGGALLPSLYEAAALGLLRYFVVDEAHVVAQWGDSFRPAFQALSGIRRGLLNSSKGEPFRTVLMSATLSPETIDTLDVLFGPPAKTQMVAAVHLRPEPRYWTYKAYGWEEKKARVLELIQHAPRPFILYVTERQHARDWVDILRDAGYRRVECFHGGTSDDDREAIIESWSANEIEGIVATSAFGVGMDKEDIRSVIHATVPETLDRYYQEVGRGGRDGRPSVSVVVYTDRDIGMARSLSKPTFIGDDNGYERWNTMFGTARSAPETDIIAINIASVPPRLRQESDYTTAWNMRTLILMARAGMVELDSQAPEPLPRLSDEPDADYDRRLESHWEAYFGTFCLRTLDPAHLSQQHFEACLQQERSRGGTAADRSFAELNAVIAGEREIGEVLTEAYSNFKPGRTVVVSPVCGGCPGERKRGLRQRREYQVPVGVGITRIELPSSPAWQRRFPSLDGRPTVILYQSDEAGVFDGIARALRALVTEFGVCEISAAVEVWAKDTLLRTLHHSAPSGVLVARTLEEDASLPAVLPLPRASLLKPWGINPIPDHLLLLDRPLHTIFAPVDVESEHPLRRYVDTATNCISLENFLQAIDA
jgi:ATP-dependent DNA helicase RecQ